MLDLGVLGQVSETSLTRDVAFKMESSGLPNTFVPGRNLLFLTLAAALAYRRDLQVMVTGVCETDFSGYPDCRDDTMKAMQLALSLGMDKRFLIETPLMWIDKADTWALAASLGGQPLVDLIIEHTHTCYLGRPRAPPQLGATAAAHAPLAICGLRVMSVGWPRSTVSSLAVCIVCSIELKSDFSSVHVCCETQPRWVYVL